MELQIIDALKAIRYQCTENGIDFHEVLGQSWWDWNSEIVAKIIEDATE
jgi:hypothetical protein